MPGVVVSRGAENCGEEIARAVLIGGPTHIRKPDGSIVPAEDKTDWARLRAMTEEEIEANALSDPDNLPMTDEDWAQVVKMPVKQYIHLGLDRDVIEFFKQDGRGYQTRINKVLRTYMEARRRSRWPLPFAFPAPPRYRGATIRARFGPIPPGCD